MGVVFEMKRVDWRTDMTLYVHNASKYIENMEQRKIPD
jgi:hypothetical protein